MNVNQVSKDLGITPATVFRMIKNGGFPRPTITNLSGGFEWSEEVFGEWKKSNPAWVTCVHEFDMTSIEVCQKLEISMPKMYRLIKSGDLPPPNLVRRVDRNGNLYGGLMKVWNFEMIARIADKKDAEKTKK